MTGKNATLITKMTYFCSRSPLMRRRYSVGRIKGTISVFQMRKKTSRRMMTAVEYSPVFSYEFLFFFLN